MMHKYRIPFINVGYHIIKIGYDCEEGVLSMGISYHHLSHHYIRNERQMLQQLHAMFLFLTDPVGDTRSLVGIREGKGREKAGVGLKKGQGKGRGWIKRKK